MCGIIGYCGPRRTADVLIEGLKRLEYRGYDSAGIAVARDTQELKIYKKKGKIRDLQKSLPPDVDGLWGIGHTRWATHGGVTDENAHPHSDASGKIALVHNGIIENHSHLRQKLEADGHVFLSETDSEVVAHLVGDFYEGNLEKALKSALALVKGTYGIACMHLDQPNTLVGARNGSPLVLGIGEDEMFLASDVTAFAAFTDQVVYMEDGEVVSLNAKEYRTTNREDVAVAKEVDKIGWEMEEMEKGGYAHFMMKEIYEQPGAIFRGMRGRLDSEQATGVLGGLNLSSQELLHIERVKIIAAGTSYHAGQVGAYLLESMARIPATAELASELRYRNPIVEKNTLYFAVSQSGETADTLYAMKELQRKGARVLGICNVVGSSIPRQSDGGVYIHSGPEISVASTKAFTSQITIFYIFSLLMARMRHISWAEGNSFIKALETIPEQLETILARKEELAALAKKYAVSEDFLFLGRGINYPVALEGALKLKEISYIHAEGYSAAEIKHGPIALVNEKTPSFFVVPNDGLHDKIMSNMKEIKAREGKVLAVAVEGDDEVAQVADDVFYVPQTHELLYPYLMVAPLQLFSYYCALELGRDVDQPRNLAKSVTVE